MRRMTALLALLICMMTVLSVPSGLADDLPPLPETIGDLIDNPEQPLPEIPDVQLKYNPTNCVYTVIAGNYANFWTEVTVTVGATTFQCMKSNADATEWIVVLSHAESEQVAMVKLVAKDDVFYTESSWYVTIDDKGLRSDNGTIYSAVGETFLGFNYSGSRGMALTKVAVQRDDREVCFTFSTNGSYTGYEYRYLHSPDAVANFNSKGVFSRVRNGVEADYPPLYALEANTSATREPKLSTVNTPTPKPVATPTAEATEAPAPEPVTTQSLEVSATGLPVQQVGQLPRHVSKLSTIPNTPSFVSGRLQLDEVSGQVVVSLTKNTVWGESARVRLQSIRHNVYTPMTYQSASNTWTGYVPVGLGVKQEDLLVTINADVPGISQSSYLTIDMANRTISSTVYTLGESGVFVWQVNPQGAFQLSGYILAVESQGRVMNVELTLTPDGKVNERYLVRISSGQALCLITCENGKVVKAEYQSSVDADLAYWTKDEKKWFNYDAHQTKRWIKAPSGAPDMDSFVVPLK